jgi:hypothetical protein
MSEHSRQLLEALRRRLQRARRRVLTAELVFGAVLTLGVLAAALGLGAALEAGLWMGTAARLLFFVAFLLAAAGLVGTFVVRPLLRFFGVLPGLDDHALAAAVGRRFPDVSDRLVNLLDLADGRASDAPSSLLDGAVQMLGRQIEPVPFERVEDLGPARRTAPAAAVPVLGLLLFGLFAPTTFTGAVDRLFSPTEAFAPPAPFILVVSPGDVDLVRGDDLTVEVAARGRALPRQATLVLRRDGEERTEEIRLVADSTGAFRHTVTNLRETLRYRVESAPVQTDWFTAAVVARPTVEELQVTVDPPAYTRLPAQRLAPNVGDVTGLPGTTVRVRARVGGVAVDSARIVFDDGSAVRLDADDDTASGAFPLRSDGAYRLVLHGANGFDNADPITYTLQALTDARPQIRLREPEADAALTEALRTRVAVNITDDFGFARLRLYWRIAGDDASSDFAPIDLPLDDRRLLDQDVAYDWLIRSAAPRLAPGDAVEYFVQVWDNDAVAGYKSARTPTYTLRFPSLTEQYEQLDEAQDEAEGGLEEMLRDEEETREQFEELRDELRRKQDADWEDRRQLDNLIERQQQLEEQVQQSAEQMEDVLDQMRENDLVSEETMRQYEELQRVLEEIATPELMEALQKLQEAMENLDLQQMMESMEEFEFNEEQFRERMERALELFEKMKAAQKMDEAAQKLESLAEQETALQEQTEELEEQQQDGELSDEEAEAERQRLAEEQQRAQEEAAALQEMMQEMQEQMEDMQGAPQEGMQELQEQIESVQEQMKQNSEQLQQNQLQDAQQGQQQMQQQLKQMAQQMQQMGQQMQQQRKSANVAGLRRALDDVLTLSYEQEGLTNETARQSGDSPALRPTAAQQVELSAGLATVSDSLRSLAREVPQMDIEIQRRTGEALREMGAAVEQLAERRVPQAAGHQKASMTNLNDLALLLSDLMDQMQNQSSGSGQGSPSMQQMMQQLQQMSGQQQQLNQQLQQMLNDMQGQRLTQDQQGRLQQMRQQQEALRQQLEEMARSGELDAGTKSQLRRIAEEMEEVARQLDGGRITRETRERQQNILNRLLEARESINQRGKKPEREGQTGDDRPLDSPPDLPEQEEIDRLRRDLIRALESGYAPDYQELIKRYFELLQQRNAGS